LLLRRQPACWQILATLQSSASRWHDATFLVAHSGAAAGSATQGHTVHRKVRMQVTTTIIDFHLVEKCRTKFRAFVKSFGAHVKFEPVTCAPCSLQYHGVVTVTRPCKQQFLTQNPHYAHQGRQRGDAAASMRRDKSLQCAAPVPVTTGAGQCCCGILHMSAAGDCAARCTK
jgi:hypothetical protein